MEELSKLLAPGTYSRVIKNIVTIISNNHDLSTYETTDHLDIELSIFPKRLQSFAGWALEKLNERARYERTQVSSSQTAINEPSSYLESVLLELQGNQGDKVAEDTSSIEIERDPIVAGVQNPAADLIKNSVEPELSPAITSFESEQKKEVPEETSTDDTAGSDDWMYDSVFTRDPWEAEDFGADISTNAAPSEEAKFADKSPAPDDHIIETSIDKPTDTGQELLMDDLFLQPEQRQHY